MRISIVAIVINNIILGAMICPLGNQHTGALLDHPLFLPGDGLGRRALCRPRLVHLQSAATILDLLQLLQLAVLLLLLFPLFPLLLLLRKFGVGIRQATQVLLLG